LYIQRLYYQRGDYRITDATILDGKPPPVAQLVMQGGRGGAKYKCIYLYVQPESVFCKLRGEDTYTNTNTLMNE